MDKFDIHPDRVGVERAHQIGRFNPQRQSPHSIWLYSETILLQKTSFLRDDFLEVPSTELRETTQLK